MSTILESTDNDVSLSLGLGSGASPGTTAHRSLPLAVSRTARLERKIVMPARFDLIIAADYPNRTAEFTLLNSDGVQLAWRQTDFKTISVSDQQGLFDLRNYLRHYVEGGKEQAAVAEIGVCITRIMRIMGPPIFHII